MRAGLKGKESSRKKGYGITISIKQRKEKEQTKEGFDSTRC